MENRIKEQQLGLFADRTSAHTLRANQLRLWLSSVAYMILNELRRITLAGTELAHAQVSTIRTRMLKFGTIVTTSVRRIRVSPSSVFPLQHVWWRVLENIHRHSRHETLTALAIRHTMVRCAARRDSSVLMAGHSKRVAGFVIPLTARLTSTASNISHQAP
ncbi:Transposase DDE domain group 1 [Nannocystis exedens]|uniref:Transposase DDE domain group 1 n=2 Tax=Nannocystis exedens TaxID=54 RepID=A0A1I2CXN7_9BACT|nr:hypothetical protein NAEX_01666 [Nannocystis exedens]SFE73061.1 Transposase DDE domain group 1 [Nannocystis exedens]